MTLAEFHARLGNAGMLFALALGLWALWLYFRKQGVDGNYLGAMVIGELLFIAQGVIGATLYFAGHPLGRTVHILYGILAVITLPGAYAYTRGRDERREALVYGLVGLFLFGVALRAITTAR
ncbi:MAG: hypothetical protein HY023_18190 [Chloroflexi bacterium]|nr:hypothetical protein [Chloroflexota bacterium]